MSAPFENSFAYDVTATVAGLLGSALDAYIDGELVPSADGATFTTYDPATALPLAQVALCGVEDVDRAVGAARRAFDEGPWRSYSPARRAQLLFRLADAVEELATDFAQLDSLDNGKPVEIAAAHDVPSTIEFLRYYAGWPTKIDGRVVPISVPGTFCTTLREPVGVCAQIVPWNFPLGNVVWKIAPALAAGCTVVVKPAEQTPLSALLLARLVDQVGFPAGVVNILPGDGQTGAALVRHPGVDKISFTGSTEVGRQIGAVAGGQLKRVSLELGGKSPLVILPDADLDLAAFWAYNGMYYNAGQVCTAASRLFAHSDIYDDLLTMVARRATEAKLGPGMDPATEFGPVVSAEQQARVRGYIAGGRDEGVELVAGGDEAVPGTTGYFVRPTLFSATGEVEPRLAREEIFGPVLVASPFDEVDDIVDRANTTPYGLAAGVFTADISRAHRIAAGLRAGMVFVNQWGGVDPAAPFGGVKSSGVGRENGPDGLDAYLETKTVWTAINA